MKPRSTALFLFALGMCPTAALAGGTWLWVGLGQDIFWDNDDNWDKYCSRPPCQSQEIGYPDDEYDTASITWWTPYPTPPEPLVIELSTESIAALLVAVDPDGEHDVLDLRFESQHVLGNTLTTKYIKLNAAEGTILITVRDDAELRATMETAGEPVCDTVFLKDSGNWHDDNDWDNQRPDSTKVGCIPAGKFCSLVNVSLPAEAKAIMIESTAELFLAKDATLTLYEDSTVNGVVTIRTDSQIIIAQDLTISGDGGEINGVRIPTTGVHPAIEGPGTLTIEGACAMEDHTLLVHGFIDIQAPLINKAFVVADGGDELLLSVNSKTAVGGTWRADGGTLKVDTSVTGDGHWDLATGDPGQILIQAACTDLTGNVSMTGGFLTLEEDFWTSGDFFVRSEDDSEGHIRVTQPYSARFNY